MATPEITELHKYSEIEVDMNEKKHILHQWMKNILYHVCVSLPIMAACVMFFAYMEIVQEDWLKRVIVFLAFTMFAAGFIRTVRSVQQQIRWYQDTKKTEWIKQPIYIENAKRGKLYGAYIKEGQLYQGEIVFHYSDNSPGAYKTLIHMKCGNAPILLVEWLET